MAASAARKRALLAGCLAGAHHRLAHLAHDRAHVGEVEIDQALLHHQVGDAGDARVEHLVGHREGVGECGLLVRHPEQVLVRDDDLGVDAFLQFDDAGFGEAHAALALEVERLGDHADGQDAELLGDLRHHRGCAGAGAAAHAGGDEHHVRAGQMVADLVDHLLGGSAPDVGLRTRAETFGDLHAHLDDALGLRRGQRLGIGVGDDEVDPLKPGRDHVVDGVSAGSADAEYGQPRLELADIGDLQVDAHGCLLLGRAPADAAGSDRTATGRLVNFWVNGVWVIRSSPAAIVRPERCSRVPVIRCRVRRGSKCSRCAACG